MRYKCFFLLPEQAFEFKKKWATVTMTVSFAAVTSFTTRDAAMRAGVVAGGRRVENGASRDLCHPPPTPTGGGPPTGAEQGAAAVEGTAIHLSRGAVADITKCRRRQNVCAAAGRTTGTNKLSVQINKPFPVCLILRGLSYFLSGLIAFYAPLFEFHLLIFRLHSCGIPVPYVPVLFYLELAAVMVRS